MYPLSGAVTITVLLSWPICNPTFSLLPSLSTTVIPSLVKSSKLISLLNLIVHALFESTV